MIMKRIPRSALCVFLLFAALASADAQSNGGSGGGAVRVLSPTVVATWILHQDETGAAQLDLLVLWRGSPGWFTQGGGGGGGGSRGPDDTVVLTMRIQYGDVDLELGFDPVARTAQLDERQIPLGDANVILIGQVDTLPQVVETTRVESTIPESGRRIEMVLRRSNELLEYLRCDVRLFRSECAGTDGVPLRADSRSVRGASHESDVAGNARRKLSSLRRERPRPRP